MNKRHAMRALLALALLPAAAAAAEFPIPN